MWAIPRTAPKRLCLSLTRSFAEIVRTITSGSSPTALTSISNTSPHVLAASSPKQLTLKDRIPVREDHGLYAFFRRKDGADLVGDARYEVVETPEKMQKQTGRAWKASELRLKSFRDLHTLWYVLLRERNLLATQKEEARRMGVTNTSSQVSADRVHQCRKSMARIKAVLNERRLAYEGAVKLAEQQKEEYYDNVVLQHQVAEYKAERRYLQRRREYMMRRIEAKRLKAAERDAKEKTEVPTQQENIVSNVIQAESSETPAEEDLAQAVEAEIPIQSKEPEVIVEERREEAHRTETIQDTEVLVDPRRIPPSKPVDTAVAGLFGDVVTPQKTTGRWRP